MLALVQDDERRGRLADLVAAVQDGELGERRGAGARGADRARPRRAAASARIYGPEGEQAALKTFRRLPGGRALSDSAGEVTEAFGARGKARSRR